MSLLLLDELSIPTQPVAVPYASVFEGLIAAADRLVIDKLGGSPVIYQPADGDAVEVSGVFDQLYVLAQGNAHAGVETLGPAVFLRLDDLPVNPDDDDPTLTIGALTYRVIERKRDGIGGIVLALRLVQ